MNTTFERLSALLIKDFKLSPERLTLDAPLQDLGIDSLGTVELLWSVEEVFGIKLPSDPVELLTLGEVAAYIDRIAADTPAGST
jgi:acyl carrier protein